MKLQNYLCEILLQKAKNHRILVWYDSEHAFGEFVAALDLSNTNIISAGESGLSTLRKAQQLYRQMEKPGAPYSDKNANLLIYIPDRRASDDETRTRDPFESFAHIGTTFGDTEAEQLKSLAMQALPEFSDQIERLFNEGQPSLAVLDSLERSPAYPLVNQTLGTRSAVEVAALILGDADSIRKITGMAGCAAETLRLLQDELGFAPPKNNANWEPLRTLLARFVFFSEFVFDLNTSLPEALANLIRAGDEQRERIFAIADRLRDSTQFRESYLDLAGRVEQDLELPRHFEALAAPGQRDTFAFEERIHLRRLTKAAESNDLSLARGILNERRTSVWRHLHERAQIWAVAERCITLLEVARRIQPGWKKEATSVKSMVQNYARENGWSDLDRAQRLMEQSIAECTSKDELEGLIEQARGKYRDLADDIQRRFLEKVEAEGWPPDDVLRQTQVYDRFVSPLLDIRGKTAYFLADSLRFEMGRDLTLALAELGEVNIEPAAASLPTITEIGMAALLPGADGALTLKLDDEEPVPCIGERPVKDLTGRLAFLREKLGDRMVEMTIGDFLSLPSSQRQASALKNADLVIMRDPRIDQLGESVSLKEARRYMTDMLGDLKSTAMHLVKLGYSRIVIASDHGHMLLPEIRPGDVTTQSPDGKWGWSKRRFRLGHIVQEQRGTRIFSAIKLGIQGDMSDLVLPEGFGLYARGSGYFHGGLSLQESLIPVISVTATQKIDDQSGSQEIKIIYRSDTFTSRVIGLKVWYNSLMTSQLRAKVEAFDGSGPRAQKVGDVVECDARDEISHEVTFNAGEETPVPLLLDADFSGKSIEIRVTNPDAPVVWARLSLKNGILD
jgi:hypothetical protein